MKRIKIRRPDADLENQIAERAQRSEATLASADGLMRHCARAGKRFRSPDQYASDVTLLAMHMLKVK